MLPLLRYAKVFLRLGGRGPADLRGSTITFRVWPNDLDLNRHMTNSRYFALMDAARYDLVIRSGAWAVWRRNGWFPVVASQRIRFRRSLKTWRTFTIRTTTAGWDERNLYLTQVFEQDGHVCAEATVRASLLSKGGKVPLQAIMEASGWQGPAPVLAERIKAWVAAELAQP